MMSIGLSLADLDLSWHDPYDLVAESVWLQILLLSIILIVLILGTVLHGSIILYEHFGGDPQKRGLVNQLISHISALSLAMYWAYLLFLVWRIFVSPVTNYFWWFWWFICTLYAYAVGLTAIEYLFVKYYFIVIAMRIVPILDDFFALFLARTNIAIGAFFGLANCYTEEGFLGEMRTAGLPPLMTNYTRFRPRILALIFIAVLLVYFLLNFHLQLQIRRIQGSPNDRDQGSHDSVRLTRLNTSRYNPEAVAISRMIMAALLGSFAAASSSLGNFVESFSGDYMRLFIYFSNDITNTICMMILVPMAFILGNSDVWRYVKSMDFRS